MKQILSLALTSPSLGTHLEFHTQVNSFIELATAAALKVESQAAQYAELVAQEAMVVNRPTAQRYTEQLAESDRRRDDASSVVLNIIKAQVRSIDPDKRAAAQELRAVIAPYNDLALQAYLKETAMMRGLGNALKEEKNAPLVTLLGLDEDIDLMLTANDDFEALYQKSQEEAVTRQQLEAIDTKELRKQVDTVYQQIVLIVNAFAIASPSDEINAFIDNVNGLIYRVQQEMDKTHSTGTPADPTPDEGGETPEPGGDGGTPGEV